MDMSLTVVQQQQEGYIVGCCFFIALKFQASVGAREKEMG